MTQANDIIGAWSLESWTIDPEGDGRFAELWPGASGSLLYTPEGMMSAIICEPSWIATAQAPARGFSEGLIAYGGPFSVEAGHVHHHVEQSNIRNWIATTMSRRIERIDDDSLILVTPETTDTLGQNAIHRIRWRRVSAQ
jgi:Lipocalin-like domain